jgi:hypothetical protein
MFLTFLIRGPWNKGNEPGRKHGHDLVRQVLDGAGQLLIGDRLYFDVLVEAETAVGTASELTQ